MLNEDDYQRLVARRQRIAAHIWGEKTHEVESEFPFLTELEDRYPREVKAVRRVCANERIVAERIEHKRLTNPDHDKSAAYNRLLRKRDKLNRQGRLRLNQLVLLAAIHGRNSEPTDRTCDVMVAQLENRIEENGREQ